MPFQCMGQVQNLRHPTPQLICRRHFRVSSPPHFRPGLPRPPEIRFMLCLLLTRRLGELHLVPA